MTSPVKPLLGVALVVVGAYWLYRYIGSLHWNDPPAVVPGGTLEHQGNDYSSTPYPSCLPFGNSNLVQDPNLPHQFCFDGGNSLIFGPSNRFQ